MATVTENQRFDGSEFAPFNDANPFGDIVVYATGSEAGYDTRAIDQFRQGVSIKTAKHLYESMQPKFWAGNLDHFVLVRTIGQARSFTEYYDDKKFGELPRFNPVQYIRDQEFPYPILFNDGPQQEEEAAIEPLTIPFIRPSIEGKYPARAIKAYLEDGNSFDNDDRGTTRISQFIEFTAPNEPRFFLDEGQEYWGAPFPALSLPTDTLDPIAFYTFDGSIADSSGNGYDLALGTGTLQYSAGPITGTQAVFFDGSTALTGTIVPQLHLSGNMTMQMLAKFHVTGGQVYTVAGMNGFINSGNEVDNILYYLGFADGNTNGEFYSLVQSGSAQTSDIDGTSDNSTPFDTWTHVALVRDTTTKIYLNGIKILDVEQLQPTGDGANSEAFLQVGGTASGSAGTFFPTSFFTGSLSSLKIHDFAFTEAQILSEISASGLVPLTTQYNSILRNSIIVEGFTPIIQREINPFDETRDERIVNRIRTSDEQFIAVLKSLKFDLDGDIREDFDKKSAPAGSDVYGPDAGLAGTDSIAFVGRYRGA